MHAWYVHVGSILLFVGIVTGSWWEVLATVGICLLVMARHLGNMKRLITRREHALT